MSKWGLAKCKIVCFNTRPLMVLVVKFWSGHLNTAGIVELEMKRFLHR